MLQKVRPCFSPQVSRAQSSAASVDLVASFCSSNTLFLLSISVFSKALSSPIVSVFVVLCLFDFLFPWVVDF